MLSDGYSIGSEVGFTIKRRALHCQSGSRRTLSPTYMLEHRFKALLAQIK